MKKPLGKIYDPVERIQHIQAPPYADQVTLCGQTDWLLQKDKPAENTAKPVDCNHCKWVFDYCNSGTWPK